MLRVRARDLSRLHALRPGRDPLSRARRREAAGDAAPALKRQARATRFALTDALIVTKVLIGANVAVFLINLAQGASLTRNDGNLFADWALFGPLVANGDWWRLLTSAFLHASLIHLAFNMLFLWWIGGPMEAAIGHARFVALYLFPRSPGRPERCCSSRRRSPSALRARSSGSSGPRSSSSGRATTCSAARRSGSC